MLPHLRQSAGSEAVQARDDASPAGSLLRTDTGCTVLDADPEIQLGIRVIKLSGTLTTAYDAAEEGSCVPFHLEHSQVRRWREHVSRPQRSSAPSTTALLQILQASSLHNIRLLSSAPAHISAGTGRKTRSP